MYHGISIAAKSIPGAAIALASLLLLFVARVLAQLIQLLWPNDLLPEFAEWQSGTLPYGALLASQIAIVALSEGAEARSEPGGAKRNRGGDGEIADDLLARIFQRALGDDGGAGHFAGEFAERHAGAGQQKAARVPLKEGDAHVVFERGDLAADGGLADAKLLGGGREAAGLGGEVEGFEFVPVHRWPCFRPRRGAHCLPRALQYCIALGQGR